jgi:hypothetical protein
MHTGRVDLGTFGIVAVLVLGTAVVVYGWLADRTADKHRRDALVQPPDRPIPGLPTDAKTPAYLAAHDALRRDATRLSLPELLRTGLHARLAGAPSLPFGHADPVFVTDAASGYCVLENPLIVVSDDAVTTVRELLPSLEKAGRAKRPLVVVAPKISLDVIATLAVNAVQETLACVAVLVPDAGQRRALCSLVGGAPLSLSDLRAGYLPDDSLGTCAFWVCDAEKLWVVNEEDEGGPS